MWLIPVVFAATAGLLCVIETDIDLTVPAVACITIAIGLLVL